MINKYKYWLLFLLVIIIGCAREYYVTIHNHGDHNNVTISVSAAVPTTIDTKLDADVGTSPRQGL